MILLNKISVLYCAHQTLLQFHIVLLHKRSKHFICIVGFFTRPGQHTLHPNHHCDHPHVVLADQPIQQQQQAGANPPMSVCPGGPTHDIHTTPR